MARRAAQLGSEQRVSDTLNLRRCSSLLAGLIIALAMAPSMAGADPCTRPPVPDITSNVNINLAQLRQMRSDFKVFQEGNRAYLQCLNSRPDSETNTQRHDRALALEQKLAAQLNRHIRRYRLLHL